MALYRNGCDEHQTTRRTDCYKCVRLSERRALGQRVTLGKAGRKRHKLDSIIVSKFPKQ